jgi:hypothetical protein
MASTQRRAAAHVNAELPLGAGVPALPGSEMERYRPSFLKQRRADYTPAAAATWPRRRLGQGPRPRRAKQMLTYDLAMGPLAPCGLFRPVAGWVPKRRE